jgi:DNA mismatch endonuclease (patch repair protein)
MRRVRREHTSPELAVRQALHAAGLRFRLHTKGLPGTPDLVLKGRSSVVFVNGCFWHGHDCAHGRVAAKSNARFWQDKIAANRARDARQRRLLRALGWHVHVVWECQTGDTRRLQRLVGLLRSRGPRQGCWPEGQI